MCNCSSIPTNICNQCAQGNACGCPPDYTVMEKTVECKCCPIGYSYVPGATPNTSGTCVSSTGAVTATIACPSCEQTLSSDCVILPAIPCLGLPAGYTTTELANFLCSEKFILGLLVKINTSSTLATAFCQLVNACPPTPVGSTPIIGPIIVSFP